ncbi:MAG: exopolysaccharide biosynthesis protein [Hyphomicrobiaceae bacterium]
MQQPLSQIVENVFDPEREATTYGAIIDEIGQHGLALILILFALPSALPVPAAGYSTVLSIPLFFIGFRLLAGYDTLWLPKSLRAREFDPGSFSRRLLSGMLKLIRMVEYFARPRFEWFTNAKFTRMLVAVVILALAASMALPIPGTNTAPAFGIFLIGFALLEEDGLLLVLGILASLVALAISLTIIFFGYQTYLYLKGLILGAKGASGIMFSVAGARLYS